MSSRSPVSLLRPRGLALAAVAWVAAAGWSARAEAPRPASRALSEAPQLSARAANAQPAAPAASAPASTVTRPGQPLDGLSAAELARFERGRAAFARVRSIEDGLGPLFNDSSCHRCHNRKGIGGAGIQSARMAGRVVDGAFDALLGSGGPSLASASVRLEPAAEVRRLLPRCALPRDGEPVPQAASVVVRRRTTALFGLGLVDATPDATFLALAAAQPPGLRGRAARLERAGASGAVGKLGWKAQAASLREFTGLALLMELGITSAERPEEQAPLGDASLIAACDAVAEPEAAAAEVDAISDFMRLLAPVAPLPQGPDARAGDRLFSRFGCDGCHTRRITSGASDVAALSEKTYAPYSDFLLHDMGALGDGIWEGAATGREMRTAPLWGLRLSGTGRLLHDGRARSLSEAIQHHEGQGAAARGAFERASDAERRQLSAFLETL